jgi:chemotaxis protein methyltransferase CheR
MSTARYPLPDGLPVHTTFPNDYAMTADDFGRIATMLREETGIDLSPSKATLVYSRLAKRLRLLGLDSFHDYCTLVAGHDAVGERQQMMAALTTNITRFFREPHHFAHLKAQVLPTLLDSARLGARVRIWSAACSSGEEPYSIALTVLSLMPDAGSYDIKILATDINASMIAKGVSGQYGEADLRDVEPELRRRWFSPTSTDQVPAFRAATELRKLVTFRRLNLFDPWPMRGQFQVVFCRNVVIYFDDETQSCVWTRILPILCPGGHLYIGHSERISGPATNALCSDGITTYRRVDGVVR